MHSSACSKGHTVAAHHITTAHPHPPAFALAALWALAHTFEVATMPRPTPHPIYCLLHIGTSWWSPRPQLCLSKAPPGHSGLSRYLQAHVAKWVHWRTTWSSLGGCRTKSHKLSPHFSACGTLVSPCGLNASSHRGGHRQLLGLESCFAKVLSSQAVLSVCSCLELFLSKCRTLRFP